jgi:VCBS repeat-containing protein
MATITGSNGTQIAAYLAHLSAVTNAKTGEVSNGSASDFGSFSVANAAVQHLREGQVLTQTYTVTIKDNSGTGSDSVTQDVTVTITGTNDAPVLSTITAPAPGAELANASAQDLAPISGTLSVSDLDVGDTLSTAIAGTPTLVWSGGSLTAGQITTLTAALVTGKLAFGGTATSNGGASTIGYTYDPATANLDFLRAGDTLKGTAGVAAVHSGGAVVHSGGAVVHVAGGHRAGGRQGGVFLHRAALRSAGDGDDQGLRARVGRAVTDLDAIRHLRQLRGQCEHGGVDLRAGQRSKPEMGCGNPA